MKTTTQSVPSALATFALVLAAVAAAAQSSNWPQWRGPERNGVSKDTGPPSEWAEENILWKTLIRGRGHSSPVIWGDRMFLTTDIEGDVIPGAHEPEHIRGGETYRHPASESADRRHTLEVLALNVDTGELLWSQVAHDGRVFDNRHHRNTYASPSAVTDGEGVYVYFGSQGVFAYDFDGKQRWSVDLGNIATWGHGHGTSPLLYRDRLILQIDQDEGDGSFLVALNKNTGEQIWRTPRDTRINYSSPVLREADGKAELIATSYHEVMAYDPDSGEELWTSEGFLGNAVPTPIANGNTVFVASGYPDKLTKAIRLGAPGTASTPELLWEYKKGQGYVPSPLLYGDYLYLVSDKGILTCLDRETGKVVYEGGRLPIPTTVKASPVAWGDKILLGGEDGDFFVIQAGPEYRILSHNTVGEIIVASPAVVGDRLYIRGEQHVFAIGAQRAATDSIP